jgi:hypothetical protein
MNRRKFIKLSAWATGAIIGGRLMPNYMKSASAKAFVAPKGPISDSRVKGMVFNITYSTEIINPPKRGRKVKLWIPLAQSDQEQEIKQLSIDSPVAFNINQEPHYGNKMVYVAPASLKKGDRITLKYNVRRKTIGTIKNEHEEIKKHLVLTEREKWDNNIMNFVDHVASNEKAPLEVGRKIYYSLVDLLTYDKTIPGCGLGISIWTFENKRGRCDDFHALFRTMMIRKEIPVKWEQGIPLPYPSAIKRSGQLEGDCTGAHCWVRFYVGDGDWVPVDISEADKREDLRDYFFGTLSPNRFKVSTGRNIVLNPSQGGEALNTFPFTHGETPDGIPLIYGHHFRNIIRYEIVDMEVS